jgi:hypothetical protein
LPKEPGFVKESLRWRLWSRSKEIDGPLAWSIRHVLIETTTLRLFGIAVLL